MQFVTIFFRHEKIPHKFDKNKLDLIRVNLVRDIEMDFIPL